MNDFLSCTKIIAKNHVQDPYQEEESKTDTYK